MMTRDEYLAMLPEWFSNTLEYPEIMQAYAHVLNSLEGNIDRIWSNNYIQTCDEPTIEAWESILGFDPASGETLETRRTRILNKFRQVVPYSERRMRATLDDMYGVGGYTLLVDDVNSAADMTIKVLLPQGILQFTQLWYDVTPAHLSMTVTEDVNFDLKGDMYFGGALNNMVYQRI